MSTVLADAFAGVNGADINGRTLDVGGVDWSVTDGAWDIQANRAHCDSADIAGREVVVLAESELSDGTIEVTVNLGMDPDIGRGITIIRAQDASHYFILSALRNTAAPTVNNTLRLLYRDGAGYFELDRSAVDLSDLDADHVVLVALDGTSIAGSIDGSHEVAATSTMYQDATLHGFAGFPGGTVDGFSFDDAILPIIVEPLSCTPDTSMLRRPGQLSAFLAAGDTWRQSAERTGFAETGTWSRVAACLPFQHIEAPIPAHVQDGMFVPATTTHTFRFHSSADVRIDDVIRMRVGNYPDTYWLVQTEPARTTWRANACAVEVSRQVTAEADLLEAVA